ncbi:MAG: TIGR01548 family HAD-type hydrolase [Phycisphaeraceae bacterium]|nr:MAG: TIGR01548 family HAD-type hydrolase [Phycisphaeraceae bacterium]
MASATADSSSRATPRIPVETTDLINTDSVRGPRPAPILRALKPYTPGAQPRPIDLKLDANEGPAPSGVLLEWLRPNASESLRRYPSAAALEAQIAARNNVTADRVIVTAGADDALERITRAVLAPGREAILTTPTFEMLSRYARLAGADVIEAPWLGEPFDVEAIESRIGPRTAAIFIVTPNNPTGQAIPAESIRRLSAAIPAGLLVVDLAYAEYADEDLTELVLSLPNAVAVRTFSKAWGLAGLRVGYAIGPAEVINWLRAVGHPYAVSGPSLAIASAWYEAGRTRVEAAARRVRLERRELIEHLRDLGAAPIESKANFVLARFDEPRQSAHLVADLLASQGIAVRRLPVGSALESYLRITLPGEPVAFNRLCTALTSALRPRAILFDMDGVIADVSASYRQAIVRTAATFGVNLSATDIARAKDAGNANNDWVLTRRLLLARGVDVPLEDVIRTFESFYQGDPDDPDRKPGLWRSESLLIDRAQLEALARRFTLAIVTGRPRRDAQRFLEHFGITDLFPVVVTMEDAPPKPDPRPITIALERLGERAAWMIGDTPDDLIAARRAGVASIGVIAPGDRATEERAFEAGRTLVASGAARVLNTVSKITELLP